eukprot:1112034-Pleurochrysis_carterae.AAC.1
MPTAAAHLPSPTTSPAIASRLTRSSTTSTRRLCARAPISADSELPAVPLSVALPRQVLPTTLSCPAA